MRARKISTEYEAFQKMTDKLLSVPHRTIKTQLDEEKKAKKRKKSKKSSASREADGRA